MSCNRACLIENIKVDEKFKKRFKIKFKFSNNDINKFILLLMKGVYPYDCMDDWEKFIEKVLAEKEKFDSNLNTENIRDADYMHAKRVCNNFEIKVLSGGVFENFRRMRLKIDHLDSAKLLSAPGLASQATFKKTEIKLELLIDIDMLLIVGKEVEEEYVTKFIDMLKLIING